jgi:mono/diheme cytochrome c family protein
MRWNMSRLLSALPLAALVLGAPTFASAADARQGRELAIRWCSSCHLVSSDQTRASADVPSFASIASIPNFSVEKLVYFLLEPHPKMPNLGLGRTEAQDLAAYIGTQGK